MLLILHNLPKKITSLDVRKLIQEQCGLREMILDDLLDEGPGKRITIGLAEEEDAEIIKRKLNGLYYKTCQLYVEHVRKKKSSFPSYSIPIPAGLQPPKTWIQYPVHKTAPTMQINTSNMPYFMTQDSDNTNYDKPTQIPKQNTSIFNRNYQYPTGVLSSFVNQAPKTNNLWLFPSSVSYPNNIPAANNPVSTTFSNEIYQNNRDKQEERRGNETHSNWRENKSPPSKRHKNSGSFSLREPRFVVKNSEFNKKNDESRHRGDNRSPLRGNSFREKNYDRRDDFGSSKRSTRSNPHEKDSYKNERQSDRKQNSSFCRQRELGFDHQERRNDQKRNYDQFGCNVPENDQMAERSVSNPIKTSTTFSSNSVNSFFTKPDRSIFNELIGSRGFGETSQNKVKYSSPKQDKSKSRVSFPVPKRARFDPPTQYFGNKKFVNPNAELNGKRKTEINELNDLQKIKARNTTWRSQCASSLAKEILKNASRSKIENVLFKIVLKKLKECIMLRLDVIMGDKIANNLDEIYHDYRTKFNNHDDIAFFNAVVEKVKREKADNGDEVTGPNLGKEIQRRRESEKLNKGPNVNPFYSPNPNIAKKKQHQESRKLNKGPSVVNPFYSPKMDLTMKTNLAGKEKQKGLKLQNRPKIPLNNDRMSRLPRYPNCDKQEFKHLQKNALLEYEEGFYTLEPKYVNAVNEEVEKLVGSYIEACEHSNNKDEETIRNKIITSTADEFKNMIKIHVTKRILNITEGLTVRIFSTPKPPPKAALHAFLKTYGAVSLKQSDTTRMFVANCDSYETYDKLLAIGTTNFGSVTIHIKPFHVLGPTKKKNKQTNQTIESNAVEDFTKDVDELEFDLTNDKNDDSDVMLIENDQVEVVFIHDDLDKSINSKNTNDIIDVNNDKILETDNLKTLHSNDKGDDYNDKVASCNEQNGNSNDNVDNLNEKVYTLNNKVDESNINASNENHKYSDVQVPNSQTGEHIKINEKNIQESVDDVFNEIDEILEEDLEDF